ncbi:class I SAM-dependent methyltransferase [Undibacterium cyanobacteriorum]|uniref:Class I SAM-dependent methyltransferase n=1 Tax=Undibacterium cyanobacteriorum TaxID=3073561 RepID=A0ABY9RLH9_9BURK|nr:class I SAM-dependent methyltransferase [Undibacterium sp. 20NA77.5]WMW82067.1 class I SAM-dependent methyltransferase [Undibacterium sp. 20NA77.5]
MQHESQLIEWEEDGHLFQALWQSANHAPKPKRFFIGDDTLTADKAYRLACEGTAIIWRGDFQNAKQLLQAMSRRLPNSRKAKNSAGSNKSNETSTSMDGSVFHLHRRDQVHRSRILGMLLIPVTTGLEIPLRRAPDVKEALQGALQTNQLTAQVALIIMSLKELLGVIGAHQWRKNGVEIPSLGTKIYPHYGVYSPVRGEYLELLAKAPLPTQELAFDIGTGSGVIAALLAKRGIKKIVATDISAQALQCARENLERLDLLKQIDLLEVNLFPTGRAGLIVCNPPWLPAKPSSAIESAIYDPDSQMLKAFLKSVGQHLTDTGEAWLIMSDLAEHLGLRTHKQLWDWITEAGLHVVGKLDIRPKHGKSSDKEDTLHEARKKEITSLWRLRVL